MRKETTYHLGIRGARYAKKVFKQDRKDIVDMGEYAVLTCLAPRRGIYGGRILGKTRSQINEFVWEFFRISHTRTGLALNRLVRRKIVGRKQ